MAYNGKPYPGLIEDVYVEGLGVSVQFMHRVGKPLETSSFFWPRSVKDVCWYRMDDVLAIIPEPKKLTMPFGTILLKPFKFPH